jgi:molybdenum cofactor synthesis domain-containing protein
MQYRAAVITASDKGAAGQREDLSGPQLELLLASAGFNVIQRTVLPDEQVKITATLIELCDDLKVDLILTTGGTGFSPRDVTPEATRKVILREVPGIPEAMRRIDIRSVLSRGIAGIRGKTLIINMPGSLKAVEECFEVIRPILDHAMEILTDQGGCHTRAVSEAYDQGGCHTRAVSEAYDQGGCHTRAVSKAYDQGGEQV